MSNSVVNSSITSTSLPSPSGVIHLPEAAQRRVHRLASRLEMAIELQRTCDVALQEALTELFENAGLAIEPTDRFSIDWRAGTVTLRPQEEP